MENIENQEFIVVVVAYTAHLQQSLYDLIELQSQEIKVLKKLYGKQPRPKALDKLRLAESAKKISRQVLEQSKHIVTGDSFRRWYRELIANTYTAHRKGRP